MKEIGEEGVYSGLTDSQRKGNKMKYGMLNVRGMKKDGLTEIRRSEGK